MGIGCKKKPQTNPKPLFRTSHNTSFSPKMKPFPPLGLGEQPEPPPPRRAPMQPGGSDQPGCSGGVLLMGPCTPWGGRLEPPELGMHRSCPELREGHAHALACVPTRERELGTRKGINTTMYGEVRYQEK